MGADTTTVDTAATNALYALAESYARRLTKLATLPLAGPRDAEYQARAKTLLAELPAE